MITKTKKIEWGIARKNIESMAKKYPNILLDCIDSAYLAGLEATKKEAIQQERDSFDKVLRSKLLDWAIIADGLSTKVGKNTDYEDKYQNSRRLNLLFKDIKKFRDNLNSPKED